jgi:hypothetical protein
VETINRKEAQEMEREILETIGNWPTEKSLGLSLSAVNALSSMGEVRQFIEDRRTLSGLFEEPPIVDEREWLRFYNSPKTLERRLLHAALGEQGGKVSGILDVLRNPVGADESSRLAALGLIVSFFRNFDSADLSPLYEVSLTGKEIDADKEELPEDSAVAFYFWVHLPCLLVYGMSPTKLMSLLSAGEKVAEKSAERLVRLDRRVEAHPKLRRWINADSKIAKFRRKKVQKWTTQTPFDKEKSSSRALRLTAGYVSKMSELLDERIEAPELRGMIVKLGDEIPADLQDYLADRTNDDFGREIRRYRDLLLKESKPDKSAFDLVRRLVDSGK